MSKIMVSSPLRGKSLNRAFKLRLSARVGFFGNFGIAGPQLRLDTTGTIKGMKVGAVPQTQVAGAASVCPQEGAYGAVRDPVPYPLLRLLEPLHTLGRVADGTATPRQAPPPMGGFGAGSADRWGLALTAGGAGFVPRWHGLCKIQERGEQEVKCHLITRPYCISRGAGAAAYSSASVGPRR